jgi:uncharacterized protein (TIGR02391 family)
MNSYISAMKTYCIVQAEKRDPFGREPHFGVDEELLLAMGKKFQSGGGELKHFGRTYIVDKSTFIVIEMDTDQVGATPDDVSSFFYRILKERKLSNGLVPPNEDVLREFGKDVTRDVFKKLDEQKKKTPTSTTAVGFDFWPLMHPKVIEVSKKLYLDGHRKQAVQDAYIALEERVSGYYTTVKGERKYGTALMAAAFAKDNPVIRLFPTTDPNHEEKQDGYMQIYRGAMMAIRNPKAHSIFDVDEVDAIEMLFLASRLFKKIDAAVKP